jgi:hypothetical protein
MAFKMGFPLTAWRAGPRKRRRGGGSGPEAEASPEQAQDYYDIPEHDRVAMHEAMSGARPGVIGQTESIEEQANDDPEGWYNLPEAVRTDVLKARGFGSNDESIAKLRRDESARAAMLQGMMRRQ